MARALTVACVLRSGGPYTVEYVERLRDGVAEHLAGHEFVCFSDVDVPCVRVPLRHDWPGWWSKIELFREPFEGTVLYLDLDTIVTGDLSELAAGPHRFTMLRDFTRPEKRGSGVMAWTGDWSRLYRDFDPDRTPSQHKTGHSWGDQGYIADHVSVDCWQDRWPGQIVSYKCHQDRSAARLVCYHGKPKPHETGWAA